MVRSVRSSFNRELPSFPTVQSTNRPIDRVSRIHVVVLHRFEQVKASNRYTLEHFDQDLRTVMWRVGVQGEQVCFIFDESNVLSPAFLER